MEKVRLVVDELQVQSFVTTSPDAQARGTVHGHDAPTDRVECATQDPAWDSCWDSCAETCYGTCRDSCYQTCDQCIDTGPICSYGSWTAQSNCW